MLLTLNENSLLMFFSSIPLKDRIIKFQAWENYIQKQYADKLMSELVYNSLYFLINKKNENISEESINLCEMFLRFIWGKDSKEYLEILM